LASKRPQIRATVDRLYEAALLLKDGIGFKLHDLQLDYVRKRVEKEEGSVVELHKQLLDAYNPDQKPWYEIPHDGYLYLHLSYHLKMINQLDKMHELVTSSAHWREAKFKACEGDAAYAEDVRELLKAYTDPLTSSDVIEVAQLFAIQRVIYARTSRYADVDLQTLVCLDRIGEALSYARLRTGALERWQGLLSIRKALQFKLNQSKQSLEVVLERVTQEMLNSLPEIVRALPEKTWIAFLSEVAEGLDWEHAYVSVQSFADPVLRVIGLTIIAKILSLKHHPQAETLFRVSEMAVHSISDPSDQSKALTAFILALSQAKQSKYIREIAPSIDHSYKHPNPLQNVVATLARMQEFETAKILLPLIQVLGEQTIAAKSLIENLIKAERLEEAGALISFVGNQHEKDRLLEEIKSFNKSPLGIRQNLGIIQTYEKQDSLSDQLNIFERFGVGITKDKDSDKLMTNIRAAIEKQQFNTAEALIQTMNDITWRAEVLRILASIMSRVNHPDTRHIFTLAEETTRSLNASFRWTETLRDMAKTLSQIGFFDQALALALSIAVVERRCETLIILLKKMSQMTGSDTNYIYNLVMKTIYQIKSPASLSYMLSQVIHILAQLGNFELAEELASSISDTYAETTALIAIASTMAQTAHADTFRMFAKVETIIFSLHSGDDRDEALNNLVRALARIREFNRVEHLIKLIEHPFWRVAALREFVRALNQMEEFDQAQTIALSIENVSERTAALCDIALHMEKEGYKKRTKIYDLAEKIALHQPRVKQSESLSYIASALAQSQDFDKAERLVSTISDSAWQSYSLRNLCASLAHNKQFQKAKTLTNSIDDSTIRSAAMRDIASAMARQGNFLVSFSTLPLSDMATYLSSLADWSDSFENLEQGLFLKILQVTLHILAWEQETCKNVAILLGADSLIGRK
jgi:hypothetical protein